MTDEHNYPPEPEPRTRVPAGQALGVMLLALVLGALFNADRIDHTAHTQPFGWQRTWAIRVTGPVRTVSDTLLLNEIRELLAEQAGKDVTPAAPVDSTTVDTVPPTPGEPGASPTTSTTIPVVLRTPTAADPLRIHVVGDSLMGWIGPQVVDQMDGQPVEVTEDWKVSSGLARPDYFDWPARLAEIAATEDPEVVVVGFGGNDAQDMVGPDGRVVVGTPEWQAEYQRRVAQVLGVLEAEGRTVYWVGLPVTTHDNIERARGAITEAVRTEIDARPWAHYVDTVPILTPDGTYTSHLPDGSGGQEQVRADDGVHPSPAGTRRIAEPVVAAIAEERKLPAP